MTTSDYRKMVIELLNEDTGLSEWEMGFLENVRTLAQYSTKQQDKIEQIWQRVFGDM